MLLYPEKAAAIPSISSEMYQKLNNEMNSILNVFSTKKMKQVYGYNKTMRILLKNFLDQGKIALLE